MNNALYSYGPPHMAEQKQDDQLEHTFSNYVRIRDAVQKTCQMQGTIGKSGERGPGISLQPARHDDDDDDIVLIYLNCAYFSNIRKFRAMYFEDKLELIDKTSLLHISI